MSPRISPSRRSRWTPARAWTPAKLTSTPFAVSLSPASATTILLAGRLGEVLGLDVAHQRGLALLDLHDLHRAAERDMARRRVRRWPADQRRVLERLDRLPQ